MAHPPVIPAVAGLVLAAAIAGCSSRSPAGGGPTGSASLPRNSATTSASPPSGSPTVPTSSVSAPDTSPSGPSRGGGPTMSAPHIACAQGPVTQVYDGAQPNPVELCVRAGVQVRLLINPPASKTWSLPTVTPQSNVVTHAARSGHSLVMQLSAIHPGTVTVTVPNTSWQLRIAAI